MTGGRALYRELLRKVRQLPRDTQSYYARYLRQGFANWTDEPDAARLQQLAERARADADWVLRKYSGPQH